MKHLRLGVNIDHIATVRNARGGFLPDPVRAVDIISDSGGDGITIHLREDRRHIKDNDLYKIVDKASLPINMEMAATEEMLQIALKAQPHACCIVPEKRQEITTEGGLDVAGSSILEKFVDQLKGAGIKVSLFIDPEEKQIEAARKLNVDIVELHTGSYSYADGKEQESELNKIIKSVELATQFGLECHAGHGLCYQTTPKIAKIEKLCELNIGHFLVGESIFVGLGAAIKKMRTVINEARK